MSDLLDKIIEATERRGEEFNRSLVADELVTHHRSFTEKEELSNEEDSDNEEVELTPEQEFYRYANTRLLRGVRAKLGQINYQLKKFYPVIKVNYISRTLSNQVKAFDKNFESYKFLFSNLHNKDHLSLRASIFVIASIYDITEANLNKLLYYFAHCEDEYLNDYIHSLSVSLNPNISSRLLTILPFCSGNVLYAGLEILAFCGELTVQDWRQLTSNKPGRIKYFGMIQRVKLDDRDAYEYILKNAPEEFYEERLFLMLLNGNHDALDMCRISVKEDIDTKNSHIKFLGMAGEIADVALFKKHLKNENQQYVKSVIKAISNIACLESIECFRDELRGGSDFSELIYFEVSKITGVDFSKEESPFEAFDDWCEKELFRYRYRRVYKGENWSYSSHILELRDERNSGEHRLNLWSELSIRTGHKIGFNPYWSIAKQEKAIDRLNLWLESENSDCLENPWKFGAN
ncbi:MAG: hypothetical protein GY760_11135 [Deltaproteobacteria bacterium]|nr:hypothetical protein [Deltaproteobacteria bacterium]